MPQKGERICSSSAFLFYGGALLIGRCPPALGRADISYSTDGNVGLFWRHPHGHALESCMDSSLGSLGAVNWTQIIKHLRCSSGCRTFRGIRLGLDCS